MRDLLSRTKLDNSVPLKGLLPQGNFDVELSVRQYLIQRFIRLSFNKAVLYSVGSDTPLVYPLPKEWRKVLENHGLKVNNFYSALLWYTYSFLLCGFYILKGIKGIYFLLRNQSFLKKYAYFDNLSRDNISTNINKKNIINWYIQWQNRAKDLDTICHNVNYKSKFKLGGVSVIQSDGLPRLRGLKLLQYALFFIYTSAYSFIYLFFKPVHGFMLDEVLKSKRVNLACNDDLATDYLFHNSTAYFRPIWTYFAEDKGSRVLFYFYSTNNAPLENPWHLMSWPHYLVWDNYQVDFIKEFDQHNSIVEDVGAIWFSSDKECINIPSNSIAVFDVTPNRATRYVVLGRGCEYYIPSVVNQFLDDIQLVLDQNRLYMAHKIKRDSGFEHKKYVRKISQLKCKKNYIQVDPNISASHIIQATKACISLPFTSTALVASQEGKPSVYYDPNGVIQKNDKMAHGVKVLSSINDLKDWVEDITND